MTLINAARFSAFAPHALPGTLPALEAAALKHGINEPLVLAHWLGQMHVESGGFSKLAESLNYSVEALISMFGRHRISIEDANKFGRGNGHPANQNALANILYGGEWGKANLGNTEPGDGWRFRGSGFKQTTGRANFTEAGWEDDPDVLRTDVRAAADSAALFFVKHGCIAIAETDDVAALTKRINGGKNGLPDRIVQTKAAKKVVGL